MNKSIILANVLCTIGMTTLFMSHATASDINDTTLTIKEVFDVQVINGRTLADSFYSPQCTAANNSAMSKGGWCKVTSTPTPQHPEKGLCACFTPEIPIDTTEGDALAFK